MGMRKAEEVLGRGDWVHIFPEGTRTQDGRVGPARRGVARLISSCEQPPLGTATVLLFASSAAFETSLCCSRRDIAKYLWIQIFKGNCVLNLYENVMQVLQTPIVFGAILHYCRRTCLSQGTWQKS